MAGLGRVQQIFNRAVLAPIAALLSLMGGNTQQAQQLMKGHGHPVLAKLLKCSAPRANTPGYPYPGYGSYPRGKGATLLPAKENK